MAQRRMFSPQIISSEEFLTLPSTSQSLYFHLGMNADDDGFIQPRILMKTLGSSEDDLKVLLAKRFLLPFQSGVVVIKHWLIHNLIQKDRYHPTRFQDEKNILFIKENKAYTENPDSVNKLLPEVRLGKVSIDKEMPPEGDIINDLLEEKGGIQHDYQFIGLEVFEKTGAPQNKKAECIRIAKQYPQYVQKAMSFSLDYPNPALKWKMFLWKLNDLRKNATHK